VGRVVGGGEGEGANPRCKKERVGTVGGGKGEPLRVQSRKPQSDMESLESRSPSKGELCPEKVKTCCIPQSEEKKGKRGEGGTRGTEYYAKRGSALGSGGACTQRTTQKKVAKPAGCAISRPRKEDKKKNRHRAQKKTKEEREERKYQQSSLTQATSQTGCQKVSSKNDAGTVQTEPL